MYITSTKNHYLHQPQCEVFNGISSPIASKQAKIDTIEQALIKKWPQLSVNKETPEVDESIITTIHSQEYINYLKSRKDILEVGEDSFLNDVPYVQLNHEPINENAKKGYYCSDTYTPFTKYIWEVAKRSYDAVHEAGLYTLKTGNVSYALTRPPGHHAMRGKASGYCYLANASILANHITTHGVKVGILDIDYHHGNGAQTIFYERDDVVTVSIHRDPSDKFPYYTGFEAETGIGKGSGKNLNISLEENIGISEYINHLQKALQYLQDEGVEYLIVSLGFDTLCTDPICDFNLKVEDYSILGNTLASLKLPITVIQEGGYDINNLGNCAVSFFEAFVNTID